MKKIIIHGFTIVVAMTLFTGCAILNSDTDIQKINGIYTQGKGCNGFVSGIEVHTSCEDYKKYAGKVVEITGAVSESKCDPKLPQCFSGKQIKTIKTIKTIE